MQHYQFDGKKLKTLRKKKALYQKDLAIKLNEALDNVNDEVVARHIRRWENEGVEPRAEAIHALARILKCKTDDFFRSDSDKSESNDSQDRTKYFVEHRRYFDDIIEDRCKEFTGRGFVFDAIDKFIESNDCGYFFVLGDPGIGKSAIASQLVKQRDYIHHFNVRAKGITKSETFLRNICAQLIVRYDLPFDNLPANADSDGDFLSTLLVESVKQLSGKGKVVILVDALDEAEKNAKANILFLPPRLPKGVFFVITARPQSYSLRIECPQGDFRIEHNKQANLNDIEQYLRTRSTSPGICAYAKTHELDIDDFVVMMKDKSDGNFMYLIYVLPEIEAGAYKGLDCKEIPKGLENYYEDHWRRMGMMDILWPNIKFKVIYILCEVVEPVSRELIADFASDNEVAVQQVLDEWVPFMHKHQLEKELRFSMYHESFRDFLRRKDIVQAAGISIEGINCMIADNLFCELFGDE
ncbi:ATP-binding protein [Planctomycetota bacterium]